MTGHEAPQTINTWEIIKDELRAELDQTRRELKELGLMLEQSQLEVKKLTQRNASITAHLQQMQFKLDGLPRADIQKVYEAALDSQQRLFVMRGQVDKLLSDRNQLNRRVAIMERSLKALDEVSSKNSGSGNSSSTAETMEMIIQAQEAERQRLSRQMHDGPAQALSNFILQAEIAMRLFDIDQEKARKELADMRISATSTFQKVRDFIFELRPMMLDDLGLTPTVKRYIDAYKEQNSLDIRLTLTGMERRIESYKEVMVFRAIQELLSNASRHSQASEVVVKVDMADRYVKVVVDDNGNGFDVATLSESKGMGLKIIRERVEMLAGEMEIDSVIGQGTRIVFQIPVESMPARE